MDSKPLVTPEFHKFISHLKDIGDIAYDKTFTDDEITIAKMIIDKCSNNNRWVKCTPYDRHSMTGNLVLLKYPITIDKSGYTIALNSMPLYISLFGPLSDEYDTTIKLSRCRKVMKLDNISNIYIILEFCIDYISKYCTAEANYYNKIVEFLTDDNDL